MRINLVKVAVFAVEYTVEELGWGRNPIPVELRSEFRIPFFHELVKRAREEKVDLAVLPGGFFRADKPGVIAKALKTSPPKIIVLVGCDNVAGKKCEVWIVGLNGSIKKVIPQAWIHKKSERQTVLKSITDRRFQLHNKMYAVFCCGDVLIDHRKPPIAGSKVAFVLAHYSATGRSFTPAMRKLGIPVFLSHHVKNPSLKNNEYFAYNGTKDLEPKTELEGKFQRSKCKKLKWIARIYSV